MSINNECPRFNSYECIITKRETKETDVVTDILSVDMRGMRRNVGKRVHKGG
jgi:hypothetical protein